MLCFCYSCTRDLRAFLIRWQISSSQNSFFVWRGKNLSHRDFEVFKRTKVQNWISLLSRAKWPQIQKKERFIWTPLTAMAQGLPSLICFALQSTGEKAQTWSVLENRVVKRGGKRSLGPREPNSPRRLVSNPTICAPPPQKPCSTSSVQCWGRRIPVSPYLQNLGGDNFTP